MEQINKKCKLTDEEKLIRRREYQAEYNRNRYKENEDYRKKQQERIKRYHESHAEEKKKKENDRYQLIKEELKQKKKEERENAKKYLELKERLKDLV
jgi:hypothetical protein